LNFVNASDQQGGLLYNEHIAEDGAVVAGGFYQKQTVWDHVYGWRQSRWTPDGFWRW
jgi:hypothetical protein